MNNQGGSLCKNAATAAKDALLIDRTYNEKVVLPLNFVTNSRTISTWVKLDTTTFNGQTRNFMFGQYANSGQRTVYCEFRETGVIRAYISTSSSGNSNSLIESNAGVFFNANQWYYISVVVDNADNKGKIYVDGVQQTNTATTTLPFSRTGGTFAWGGFGQTSSTLKFDGTLKELAVWNTARTQSEITADMTRTYTGSETGLKAYFPTDEGSNNTIKDINSTYTGTITTTNRGGTTYIDSTMWVES